MLFSEICKILNCPANVVVGERVPENALFCNEVEEELFYTYETYEREMYIDYLIEWYEHVTDYDY